VKTAGASEVNGPQPPQPPGAGRFLNRHLSWLEFNARVLAQAGDAAQRPLERAKFLAIFSTNLDEFFEVRVAGLHARRAAGVRSLSADGLTPAEQLSRIRTRVLELYVEQGRTFEAVIARLGEAGVRYSAYASLGEEDRGHLDRVFDEQVFPVLTPLAVDPAHPFPYISSLSLNLLVVVGDPDGQTTRIARVKVPPLLPRFIVLPDNERFVPLEQVIAAHLERLFPGMRVAGHHPFRVTRNADFDVDERDEDLLSAVEEIIRKRRRSPLVMRLEIDATMPAGVLELLTRELEIGPDEVYRVEGPLDLGGLWGLYEVDRPELKDPPYEPVTQPRLRDDAAGGPADIFRVIREGDVLVHLPYESFSTSVEAFIEQAASDPDVLAIKQTLYRTSGGDSPIVRALIAAAGAGKQVVALVELKARFDEAANITWARVLERAGVHVVYGMVGLKTHAKTALVVRREAGTVRRYCHLGTGNYNQQTARLYEDLGLLTCDSELGADASDLFNHLTGYSDQQRFRRLLVAPGTLRPGLMELIGGQARAHGRIVIKANHVVDPELIEGLYAASTAGARIDLIVRSTCSVRPGVPGMSERIRVRSLVGRWLEHSRIYSFGTGARAEWYIGSADLMARNLDDRVEAVAPVLAAPLRARLETIVEVLLADDRLAWELDRDRAWHRVPCSRGVNAHELLAELARGAEEHVTEVIGRRRRRAPAPADCSAEQSPV
jgi:polyphosphate kinase